MSKLTPAQHECRMARWRYLQEAIDLGRRFKRTGPILSGDDLSKQVIDVRDLSQRDDEFERLKNIINGTNAARIPRMVFARAFFSGVDAVGNPRKEEVLVLKAQMEQLIHKAWEKQQDH